MEGNQLHAKVIILKTRVFGLLSEAPHRGYDPDPLMEEVFRMHIEIKTMLRYMVYMQTAVAYEDPYWLLFKEDRAHYETCYEEEEAVFVGLMHELRESISSQTWEPLGLQKADIDPNLPRVIVRLIKTMRTIYRFTHLVAVANILNDRRE